MNIVKPLRLISIVLTATVVISLCGCGKNDKTTTFGKAGTFFMLKEQPVYSAEEQDVTAAKRFNAIYTDKLTASSEYGNLLVYAGKYSEFRSTAKDEIATVSAPLFGLCTADGRIVVDAVYGYAEKFELDDGSYIFDLVSCADGTAVKSGTHILAAGNGAWTVNLSSRSRFTGISGGGRFMVERQKISGKTVTTYYDFYDYNGRYIFMFDKSVAEAANTKYSVGRFSEGLAPVNISIMDKKTEAVTTKAYYINDRGKKALNDAEFSECGEFRNGFAVVKTTDGLYGILKPDGSYETKPTYKSIVYYPATGYLICGSEGFFEIKNAGGETVKKIYSEKGIVELLDCDTLIYRKTNSTTGRTEYFDIETNTPFVCDTTGQFPDTDSGIGGMFWCSYNGKYNIFNEKGKTVASYTDFGGIAGRFGDYALVKSAENDKFALIPYSGGKATDWIDGGFTGMTLSGGTELIMKRSDGYAVYCLSDGTWKYKNSDYICSSVYAGEEYLTVLSFGEAATYRGTEKIISTRYAYAD